MGSKKPTFICVFINTPCCKWTFYEKIRHRLAKSFSEWLFTFRIWILGDFLKLPKLIAGLSAAGPLAGRFRGFFNRATASMKWYKPHLSALLVYSKYFVSRKRHLSFCTKSQFQLSPMVFVPRVLVVRHEASGICGFYFYFTGFDGKLDFLCLLY